MSGVLAYGSIRPLAPDASAATVVARMAARATHATWHTVDTIAPAHDLALGACRLSRMASGLHAEPAVNLWIARTGLILLPDTSPDRPVPASGGDADLEVVRDLYRSGGADALTSLAGEFVLAIWDGRSRELVIVNDRYGLYPHYWTCTGEGFAIAPELKALLLVPSVRATLDPIAIGEYTRFQQLLGERTWFRELRLLPPASVLRFTPGDGRVRIERYWDWSRIGRRRKIRLADAADEIGDRFSRAVSRRVCPGERVGVYLSGGLDSRMILGALAPGTPVTACTYGSAASRDVVLSREVARAAGVEHHVFPLDDGGWVLQHAPLHLALTEGMHAWHHMHGMTTLGWAAETIDVNLTGWGGGTLLAGHLFTRHLQGPRPHATDEELLDRLYEAFCHRLTWPGLTDQEAASVLRQCDGVSLTGLARESLRECLAKTAGHPADRRTHYLYTAEHDRRSTGTLVVFHRAAVEVRCPYFDYELVDAIYELPSAVRLDPRLRRLLLTRRMPRLASIPQDRDWRLPLLGSPRTRWHELGVRVRTRVNRSVYLFAPLPDTLYADYETYLRRDLREWAEDLLLSRRAQARGLFAPDAVRALWERHLSGKELWTIGKIAPLMTIELVLRSLAD